MQMQARHDSDSLRLVKSCLAEVGLVGMLQHMTLMNDDNRRSSSSSSSRVTGRQNAMQPVAVTVASRHLNYIVQRLTDCA